MKAEAIAVAVKTELGDALISTIYRERIRPSRTRSFTLGAPVKPEAVEVMHTLLGIELRLGRRRLGCPDLAVARYLSVFARLGVAEVAVPYDITQISRLADELESSWYRMLMLAEHLTGEATRQMRTRVRARLIADERAAVMAEGAGPALPQFNQNTKQRPVRNRER